MPFTIRDVALKAGVSPATVSKAMNGSGSVSEETQQKIRQAAKALGYQPNARARNFAQKVHMNLAIVDKRRPKANVSEVMNIIGDVKDKHVILLDEATERWLFLQEKWEQIQAANAQIEKLQKHVDEVNAREEEAARAKAEAEANSLKIYSEDESAPKLDKKKENVLKKF